MLDSSLIAQNDMVKKMPELPEVETIRRGLEKYLVGKKIKNLQILDKKLSQGPILHLKGVKLVAVRRHGKGLVIDWANKYSIAIHIKMTGQLIYQDRKINNRLNILSKHTRAIFNFADNSKLYFNDIRKFGWVKILKTSEIPNFSFFKNLGPEPLRDLTLNYFQKILVKSNLAVKVLIMDQKKIGGIGNIYANDALNLAKINPLNKSKTLSKSQIKKLFEAIHYVLKQGLKYGGASELNYLNVDGGKGSYQTHRLVYNRKGEKCFNCQGIIKKIKIGGRGTYFCESCQK